MRRTSLDTCTSYDPDTLKILSRAFDEAWPSVAGRYHHYLNIRATRERLASIILDIGAQGERDVERLKSLALQRFNQLAGTTK